MSVVHTFTVSITNFNNFIYNCTYRINSVPTAYAFSKSKLDINKAAVYFRKFAFKQKDNALQPMKKVVVCNQSENGDGEQLQMILSMSLVSTYLHCLWYWFVFTACAMIAQYVLWPCYVCHMPILYQNGYTQDHTNNAARQTIVSSFLMPKILVKFNRGHHQ